MGMTKAVIPATCTTILSGPGRFVTRFGSDWVVPDLKPENIMMSASSTDNENEDEIEITSTKGHGVVNSKARQRQLDVKLNRLSSTWGTAHPQSTRGLLHRPSRLHCFFGHAGSRRDGEQHHNVAAAGTTFVAINAYQEV